MATSTTRTPAQRKPATKTSTPEPMAAVKMLNTKVTKGAVRFDVPANMVSGLNLTNLYVRKEGLDKVQIAHTVESVTVAVYAGTVPAPEGSLSEVLTFTKETPGSVRYDNGNEGAALTNIYVRKGAFQGKKHPEQITLVVSA